MFNLLIDESLVAAQDVSVLDACNVNIWNIFPLLINKTIILENGLEKAIELLEQPTDEGMLGEWMLVLDEGLVAAQDVGVLDACRQTSATFFLFFIIYLFFYSFFYILYSAVNTPSVSVHIEMSFRNLIKSNWKQIVFTICRLF